MTLGSNQYEHFMSIMPDTPIRKGFRWRMTFYRHDQHSGTTLEHKRAVRIENNTFAWYSEQAKVVRVRHFTTDLFECRPDGLNVILSSHDSVTTRKRYRAYLTRHVWSNHGELLVTVAGPHSLILPFTPGIVVGDYGVTRREEILCMAARLGHARANEKLCELLRARGEPFDDMANALSYYKGKRWGVKGQLRRLQSELTDALHALDDLANGLWLADKDTGELKRALTGEDVLIYDAPTVEGATWGIHLLVDGFEYSRRS